MEMSTFHHAPCVKSCQMWSSEIKIGIFEMGVVSEHPAKKTVFYYSSTCVEAPCQRLY